MAIGYAPVSPTLLCSAVDRGLGNPSFGADPSQVAYVSIDDIMQERQVSSPHAIGLGAECAASTLSPGLGKDMGNPLKWSTLGLVLT